MTNNLSTIGLRLRQLLDEKGVTPYVVSEKTGISQATIGRIIKNTTARPNMSNIEVLAKYFNIKSDWLITGEGEKNLPTANSDINELVLSQQRTIEDLTSIIKVLTSK